MRVCVWLYPAATAYVVSTGAIDGGQLERLKDDLLNIVEVHAAEKKRSVIVWDITVCLTV